MSFQTGLSGLNASSRNLDVIGHNIANANTTGMKASRAEFGAMYSSMLGYGGSDPRGIGVEVGAVAQQFTQGGISTTSNSLDVAINGNGFFQLTLTDGTKAYTRDGSFKLDKDGYLKTNADANVMGFPTDVNGAPTSVTLQALKLPTNAPIGAKQTDTITAVLNLNADTMDSVQRTAAGLAPEPFTKYGTTVNVYDAAGVATPVQIYFVKTVGTGNSWDVVDAANLPLGGPITFNPATGKINAPVLGTGFGITLAPATIADANPNNAVLVGGTGVLAQAITVDLTNVTQYGTAFAIADLTQDGYTAGELTGINIGEDGVISARYSNGQTQAAGQIALADFRNTQGLSPLGGNAWAETFESGQPISGAPSTGKFGALRAGALEDSNVELTQELVNMMTAQRAYQANAQTIKTQDQIMSTLVNLK